MSDNTNPQTNAPPDQPEQQPSLIDQGLDLGKQAVNTLVDGATAVADKVVEAAKPVTETFSTLGDTVAAMNKNPEQANQIAKDTAAIQNSPTATTSADGKYLTAPGTNTKYEIPAAKPLPGAEPAPLRTTNPYAGTALTLDKPFPTTQADANQKAYADKAIADANKAAATAAAHAEQGTKVAAQKENTTQENQAYNKTLETKPGANLEAQKAVNENKAEQQVVKAEANAAYQQHQANQDNTNKTENAKVTEQKEEQNQANIEGRKPTEPAASEGEVKTTDKPADPPPVKDDTGTGQGGGGHGSDGQAGGNANDGGEAKGKEGGGGQAGAGQGGSDGKGGEGQGGGTHGGNAGTDGDHKDEAKKDQVAKTQPVDNAPKSNEPKADSPKSDSPKSNEPKADSPKSDSPKSNEPKADAPKSDSPKSNEPKADSPKSDLPKDAPKSDLATGAKDKSTQDQTRAQIEQRYKDAQKQEGQKQDALTPKEQLRQQPVSDKAATAANDRAAQTQPIDAKAESTRARNADTQLDRSVTATQTIKDRATIDSAIQHPESRKELVALMTGGKVDLTNPLTAERMAALNNLDSKHQAKLLDLLHNADKLEGAGKFSAADRGAFLDSLYRMKADGTAVHDFRPFKDQLADLLKEPGLIGKLGKGINTPEGADAVKNFGDKFTGVLKDALADPKLTITKGEREILTSLLNSLEKGLIVQGRPGDIMPLRQTGFEAVATRLSQMGPEKMNNQAIVAVALEQARLTAQVKQQTDQTQAAASIMQRTASLDFRPEQQKSGSGIDQTNTAKQDPNGQLGPGRNQDPNSPNSKLSSMPGSAFGKDDALGQGKDKLGDKLGGKFGDLDKIDKLSVGGPLDIDKKMGDLAFSSLTNKAEAAGAAGTLGDKIDKTDPKEIEKEKEREREREKEKEKERLEAEKLLILADKKKDPIRRERYVVKQGDTLESIASRMLKDQRLAQLIFEINKGVIPVKKVKGQQVIDLRAKLVLFLPSPTDIRDFRGRMFQPSAKAFQYTNGSQGKIASDKGMSIDEEVLAFENQDSLEADSDNEINSGDETNIDEEIVEAVAVVQASSGRKTKTAQANSAGKGGSKKAKLEQAVEPAKDIDTNETQPKKTAAVPKKERKENMAIATSENSTINKTPRKSNIESILGPLPAAPVVVESSTLTYVVRLGDTLRSVALKHPALQDVKLWKLLAEVNNLPANTDAKGAPVAVLKRGEKIVIPSIEHILSFREKETVQQSSVNTLWKRGGTPTKFDIASKPCPKCNSLTTETAAICPRCLYAFSNDTEKSSEALSPISASVKEDSAVAALTPKAVPNDFTSGSQDDAASIILKAAGFLTPDEPAQDGTQAHNYQGSMEALFATAQAAVEAEPDNSSQGTQQGIIKQLSDTCRLVFPANNLDATYMAHLEILHENAWLCIVAYEVYANGEGNSAQHLSLRKERTLNGHQRNIKMDLPPDLVQELAENDLNNNWSTYQERFLQGNKLSD